MAILINAVSLPAQTTLKLDYPNGKEVFKKGTNVMIAWSGIPLTDTVEIDYSLNGIVWQNITNTAVGGKYQWYVPNISTETCVLRVRQPGDKSQAGTMLHALPLGSSRFDTHCSATTVAWSPDTSLVAVGTECDSVKVWHTTSGTLAYIVAGHNSAYPVTTWSPDGRLLAEIDTYGRPVIWDGTTGTMIHTLPYSSDTKKIVISPDRSLIGRHVSGSVEIWNGRTGRYMHSIGASDMGAMSPDGSLLLTTNNRYLRIYETATNRLYHSTEEEKDFLYCEWSADGRSFATSTDRRTIKIWDAATIQLTRTVVLEVALQQIEKIDWSPDGSRFATLGAEKNIVLWDAGTGKRLHTFPQSKIWLAPLFMEWSPDGSRIASTNDTLARVWDATTGDTLLTVKGHRIAPFRKAIWNTTGTAVGFNDAHKSVHIYDIASGEPLYTITLDIPSGVGIDDFSWSPNGAFIATSDRDSVRIWNATNGQSVYVLDDRGTTQLGWSPDSKWLSTTNKIWEVTTGTMTYVICGGGGTYHLNWSPDGKRIVVTGESDVALLWDATSGRILRTVQHYGSLEKVVTWSPDGTRLLTTGLIPEIIDASTGMRLYSLQDDSIRYIGATSWSPDGKLIATGDGSDPKNGANIGALWDAETGKKVRRLNTYFGVNNIIWNPDGSSLATIGRDDGTKIYIWDIRTGSFRTLSDSPHDITPVSWSPDGKYLASTSYGEVKIWEIKSGKAILTFDDALMYAPVCWSPDGTRVIIGSMVNIAKIYLVNVPPVQEDLSDAVFSISTTSEVKEKALSTGTDISFSLPHPNPTNTTYVDVIVETAQQQQATIVLYDISGRHIATVMQGVLAAGRTVQRAELQGLAAGAYFLVLRTAGGQQALLLQIER